MRDAGALLTSESERMYCVFVTPASRGRNNRVLKRHPPAGWVCRMPYPDTRGRRHMRGAFHVFNRARDERPMFLDDDDRLVFEDMMNRHLCARPRFDSRGRQYENLRDEVRLYARCLPTSHFHNVLEQLQPGGMDNLMRRTIGPYVQHFNARHRMRGEMFPGPYRAKSIETPEQFRWRLAYVHDNHKREGLDYRFSTHRLFLDPDDSPPWLEAQPALDVFGGLDGYLGYLNARETRTRLDRILRGPLFEA